MTISSFVEGLLIKLEFGVFAHVAQLVEHVLGKDEVSGSSPDTSSIGLACGKFPGEESVPKRPIAHIITTQDNG